MEHNEKAPTAASKVDAQERLKTAAIGMASNIKLHSSNTGGEKGTSVTADIELVKKITEDWPTMSKSLPNKPSKPMDLPMKPHPAN